MGNRYFDPCNPSYELEKKKMAKEEVKKPGEYKKIKMSDKEVIDPNAGVKSIYDQKGAE